MRLFVLPPYGKIAGRLVSVCLAALTILLVSSGASQAYWRDHYYWRAGWGWAPYPGYYAPYPYYEYPPAYAYPAPVTVVPQVQVVTPPPVAAPQAQAQARAQAPGAAPDSYYYCTKPKGYYPYVQTCKVSWKLVPITPPTGRAGP